jgi:PilZ domain
MMQNVSIGNFSKEEPSPDSGNTRVTVKRTRASRRSARMVLRVPLLINTTDSNGETEWERVETVMVSLHGGMLRARQNFQVGDTLDIRVSNKDRSARARVVWTSSEVTENGVELGFEILDQEGFWEISFPPDRWSQRPQPEESKG